MDGQVIGIRAYSEVSQDRIRTTGFSGAGDAYRVDDDKDVSRLKKGQWYRLAIKWDGSNFALFINDSKVGTINRTSIKQTPLYIGGYSNATKTGYFGYANGYYRNFAIYDRALTDEEIQNYTF